jgi:signal transduction histidine kinase
VIVGGDVAQLTRALRNLLDNACKFTPEGGEIAIALRDEGGWAEVSVQDTGIGIPENDLSQLFERFHRARNAADYPGSDLGLAIVKAIVEGHGGDVRAESEGRGTRFVLRLPRRES